MKVLAFIPARGGSKGIPKKNIKLFNGKPLIYWTIKQAIKSKLVTDTYVSSDSIEILKIAKKYGASIIKRPKKISGDFATTESAIKHCLLSLKSKYDYIVLLEPTNPLKKNNDIDNSINYLIQNNFDSVFSGTKLIDFMIWKKSMEKLKSYNYNYKKRGMRQNRQDDLFLENGNIYVFKTNIILKMNNRLGRKIGVYEMGIDQYAEIDEIGQWKFTELLHKNLRKN